MSLSKGIGITGHVSRLTAVLATLMTVGGCFGQAPAPTSDAEIAWFWLGRAGFNPTNGNVLPFGYFTIINGVNSPMFGAPTAPSEATAFFSFRYSQFQAFPLPANLDQNLFLTTPATFDIYFDTKPNRNWNDPTTFSTGQKVATYARPGFQGEQLYVTQYQAYSAKLVFSTPFTFNGQTIDFATFAPGITVGDYLGVIPGPGFSANFPLVYSISSYALATHLTRAGVKTTSAVAGPSHATVVTTQFRLDGSRSTSGDGTKLRYQWTVAPGSPVATILEADTATPVIRFGTKQGVYTFKLTVTDADGNSSADFTTVNYAGN